LIAAFVAFTSAVPTLLNAFVRLLVTRSTIFRPPVFAQPEATFGLWQAKT
jgi:hypothetical protein